MTNQASEMPATHHEPALGRDRRLAILSQILCVVVPVAMTQAMEFALAGFIGCFLFWALGVVRFPLAFSGFANDTA